MTKLIIANWKLHPETASEAVALARAEDVPGLVVCPPFQFLETVAKILKRAELGLQDLSPERPEGVRYAILGHSSRRKLGETDEMVAEKVKGAVEAGITPIICIGETRAEHAAGKSKEIIANQLRIGLSLISHVSSLISIIIAYEPIWAISIEPDAKPDTPENAVAMIRFMKFLVPSSQPAPRRSSAGFLVPRFIYGGSVTVANAESFLKQTDIEGALVGGASLKPGEIQKILEVASRY